MAICPNRVMLVGGFALAVAAAPVTAVLSAPVSVAACASGEEEDTFTTVCTPFMVPRSGQIFTTIPGNPDLPAVELPGGGGAIPCTGHNSGECIGLAEEDQAMGPPPIPRSTISASP
jgi:hypothetical protein